MSVWCDTSENDPIRRDYGPQIMSAVIVILIVAVFIAFKI